MNRNRRMIHPKRKRGKKETNANNHQGNTKTGKKNSIGFQAGDA